ncbi:MAG: hypothetical protein QOI13_1042, partial [Paraburkholderia sp.]|nr:hypothetical protein [Paraburkholderia sp.]
MDFLGGVPLGTPQYFAHRVNFSHVQPVVSRHLETLGSTISSACSESIASNIRDTSPCWHVSSSDRDQQATVTTNSLESVSSRISPSAHIQHAHDGMSSNEASSASRNGVSLITAKSTTPERQDLPSPFRRGRSSPMSPATAQNRPRKEASFPSRAVFGAQKRSARSSGFNEEQMYAVFALSADA